MTKIGHQRQPNWKYFQQGDDTRSMVHKQRNQRDQKVLFLPIVLINHIDKIGSFTFFNGIQLCAEIGQKTRMKYFDMEYKEMRKQAVDVSIVIRMRICKNSKSKNVWYDIIV